MDLIGRARVHSALGDESRLAIVAELEVGDRTFQELAGLISLPGNLLAHHLDVLEKAEVIGRSVSEGDRRRRYIFLNHKTLSSLLHSRVMSVGSVLFVCTQNSARSQYAAAAWQLRTGFESDSAGSHPAAEVSPQAVQVALDRGVDIRRRRPKGYDLVDRPFDLVVSLCDRAREEGTPFTAPHLHWSVPDPVAVGSVSSFRSAFDTIDRRIDRLTAAGRVA